MSPCPLPRANSSISHWQETSRASPLIDYESSKELPEEADVVILGSGLSGALTAWFLIHSEHPPRRVVMLEARDACSGATGKNAGHCKPDQYRGFGKWAGRVGADMAARILQNEWDTYTGLSEFIKSNHLECELWQGDTFDVAMDVSTKDKLDTTYQACLRSAAADCATRVKQELDPEAAEKATRIEGAQACWSWPAATVHPIKLVDGILERCFQRGLQLYTHTPASGVERGPEGTWGVSTTRGSIRTAIVVHATNGLASTVLPFLSHAIRPEPYMCTKLTVPRSLRGANSLHHSHAAISQGSYVTVNPRTGSDGALLLGGDNKGYPEFAAFTKQQLAGLVDDSVCHFPAVKDAAEGFALAHLYSDRSEALPADSRSWTGILGCTPDHLPLVGEIPRLPGQYISAGHNGHGMARIFTASRAIAACILNPAQTLETQGIPECFKVTAALGSAKSPTVMERVVMPLRLGRCGSSLAEAGDACISVR